MNRKVQKEMGATKDDGAEREGINIALGDIYDYGTVRRNPGPLINRAATQGRPLLVTKGRLRVVMLDASAYEELVLRANDPRLTSAPEGRTGTEG